MQTGLPSDFVSICSQLQGFKGYVQDSMPSMDSGTRRVVSSLLADWDRNFIEMQRVYPTAINDVEQGLATNSQRVDGLKSKVAAAKQACADAKAAQAAAKGKAPAIKPLPAIDPDLGVSLRNELLARFGMKNTFTEANSNEPLGEIWEGWEFEPWDQN